LNPSKLAGQCGKLKCCLNYELDQYAEALKDLPSTSVRLKLPKGIASHFKTDIFKRTLYYVYEGQPGESPFPLSVDAVKEIIEMNKKGIAIEDVEDFMEEEVEVEETDFAQVVGQDSLTRFDQKRRRGPANRNKRGQGNRNENKNREQGGKRTGEQGTKEQGGKRTGEQGKQNENRNENRNREPQRGAAGTREPQRGAAGTREPQRGAAGTREQGNQNKEQGNQNKEQGNQNRGPRRNNNNRNRGPRRDKPTNPNGGQAQ
jgi:hypothetical protein